MELSPGKRKRRLIDQPAESARMGCETMEEGEGAGEMSDGDLVGGGAWE